MKSKLNIFKYLFTGTIRSNGKILMLLAAILTAVILSCLFESLASNYFRNFVSGVKSREGSIPMKSIYLYFVFYILHCLFGYLHNFLFFYNSHWINTNIYQSLIRLYLKMDYEQYHSLGSGKICSYIHKQTSSFVSLTEIVLLKLSYSFLYLMFFFKNIRNSNAYDITSKRTFLLFFILTLLYIGWCSIISSRKRSKFLVAEHTSNNVFLDILRNYNIIKSFNGEEHEMERFDNEMRHYVGLGRGFNAFIESSNLVFRLLYFFIIMISILKTYNGNGIANKDFLANAIIFINDVKDMRSKLSSIRDCTIQISNKMVSVRNSEITKVDNTFGTKTFCENSITIEYINVTITINDRMIVKNFNLKISQGDKIAITGDNGSGKSTIIKTLLGFYSYKGMILFNGIDIKLIDIASLRNCLSYVPQEPNLFNIKAIDNLKYGSTISDEDVYKICKVYNIHKIFKGLRNGYDTIIGENNKFISGGQAQTINFVRAVIKNAPIFLLDEPTSNLDYNTSRIILNNIFTSLADKTVFFTTTQPSSIGRI